METETMLDYDTKPHDENGWSAGIAMTKGWTIEGSVLRDPVGSPRGPDRFWGPPGLLANGYRGLFPQG
jgi:hypothetical protein